MTQVSFLIARMAARYDQMVSTEGSNNEMRNWMAMRTRSEGVKVRIHVAKVSH